MTESAEDAAAILERFLSGRQPTPAETFDAALLGMRRAMQRLSEAPVVSGDARAGEILAEMALAPDMDAFAAALERLDARVQAVASRTPVPNAIAQSRPRAARTLLKL